MSQHTKPNHHNCTVDDDLKLCDDQTPKSERSCCEARAWYEIQLDGKKGQSYKSLSDCFNDIGFDPERPRQEFEDGHSGFSFYKRGENTFEVFVDPQEAQKIRNKGYRIKRDN
jgi:hypothetical protein